MHIFQCVNKVSNFNIIHNHPISKGGIWAKFMDYLGEGEPCDVLTAYGSGACVKHRCGLQSTPLLPWYMEGELTPDEGSKTTVVRTPMLHHSKDYIDPRLIY